MSFSRNKSVSRSRRSVGRDFESKAASYYESLGFVIVARSWQASHKEIDLIVQKDDLLVFVEVKAARTRAFGHPAEWISKAKRQNLVTAAQSYMEQFQVTGFDIRFDVICFVNGLLEHFPSAFGAEE